MRTCAPDLRFDADDGKGGQEGEVLDSSKLAALVEHSDAEEICRELPLRRASIYALMQRSMHHC